MPANRRKFSVVIPTYNRAALLPFAVESVLAQTWGDFELVISDGGSSDDTVEVVERFDDERIRYIRSNERLTAGENYQRGLDAANGEYVTFLSDDDAYSPQLLDRAMSVIESARAEIVGYRYCSYYHEDLGDIAANSLVISNFDSSVTKFSAAEAREQVMAMNGLCVRPVDPRFICPYLSNAVYHRSVFERLRSVRKNLFDSVPPDMYLAIAVFFACENYFCLDEPLLVWSNWEGNMTASAQRGTNQLRQHYEKLLNGRPLRFTPLKFPLALNCTVNSILEAVDELATWQLEVDWSRYYLATYRDLIYLSGLGLDLSDEWREFWQGLAAEPQELRRNVRRKLRRPDLIAKRILNTRLPWVASVYRKLKARERIVGVTLISGETMGYRNVFDASHYFGSRWTRGETPQRSGRQYR